MEKKQLESTLYKKWPIIVICCVIVTVLCVSVVHDNYLLQRKYVISLAGNSFKEALTSEKVRAFKDVPVYTYYNPQKATNDLPFEEKSNYCDQIYVSKYDMNRHCLDSLFQKELLAHHLPLKSAVSAFYQSKMHYSCPDKAFYHKAVALAPVVYRMDYDPKNYIELRGYIRLPSWFILQRMSIFYTSVIIWILLMAAIIGGFLLWNKRKQKKLQEKHTALKAKIVEWTVLPNGVAFDRITGMLKYEDRTTQLVRNQLKLFCLFLDSSNHFVSYKTINSIVLKRKTETDLTNSDRNAIYGTISRLKISFEGFPPFRIITVDQKGYRLEFNDENSDYQI